MLREAIESVLAQLYPDWELCIADDASRAPHVRRVLEEYAAADDAHSRRLPRRATATSRRRSNSALALASGEFVALLDHDDLLAPDALFENALVVNRRPDVDLIYSDEDKIDEHGRRREPYFKPDWSPDSLLARNYVSHLGVYRRALVERSRRLPRGLRRQPGLRPAAARHRAHRRGSSTSRACSITGASTPARPPPARDQKDYAHDAALRALERRARAARRAGAASRTPALRPGSTRCATRSRGPSA